MIRSGEIFCMSNSLDGLQFPNPSQKQKPSTSKAGREIIAEALASVDHSASQKAAVGASSIRNILKRWWNTAFKTAKSRLKLLKLV